MPKKDVKEVRYRGYFLIDSGIKIPFDVSRGEVGDAFGISLYENSEFPFEKGDRIWLGEENDFFLLADRIIGWNIDEYELID